MSDSKKKPPAARLLRGMMFVFYGLGGLVLIASVVDGNLNNAIGGAIWFIPGAVCSYASDRITKKGT